MSFRSISDHQPLTTPYITLHPINTQPGLLSPLLPLPHSGPPLSFLRWLPCLFVLLVVPLHTSLPRLAGWPCSSYLTSLSLNSKDHAVVCSVFFKNNLDLSAAQSMIFLSTISGPKNELLTFQWTSRKTLVLDVPMLSLSSAPLKHLDVRESNP